MQAEPGGEAHHPIGGLGQSLHHPGGAGRGRRRQHDLERTVQTVGLLQPPATLTSGLEPAAAAAAGDRVSAGLDPATRAAAASRNAPAATTVRGPCGRASRSVKTASRLEHSRAASKTSAGRSVSPKPGPSKTRQLDLVVRGRDQGQQQQPDGRPLESLVATTSS